MMNNNGHASRLASKLDRLAGGSSANISLSLTRQAIVQSSVQPVFTAFASTHHSHSTDPSPATAFAPIERSLQFLRMSHCQPDDVVFARHYSS